jgi:hypothetical protein
MFESLKPYFFTIMLVCGGIVSIAISSWQFQIDDKCNIDWYNGDGTPESFTSLCNSFPYNWMRPFSVSYKDDDSCACGYSKPNTGFRLALACITVLGGVWLYMYKDKEDTKFITYWGLFAISILWYSASVADIIALVQGGAACDNFSGSDLKCGTAQYGITIAVDVLMSATMLACWVMAGWGVQAIPKDSAMHSVVSGRASAADRA